MKSAKELFDETSSDDLPPHIERLCNEIDAHFYSGDQLFSEKCLNRMRFWVARWGQQAIPFIEEVIEEQESNKI